MFNPFRIPLICLILLSSLFGGLSAVAQEQEVVPIYVPETPVDLYDDWILQNLPYWGSYISFPDTPYFSQREIYTEKGLVPEQYFKYEDREQTLLLEVSAYKLPEKLTDKNEKKLVDAVAQRYAIIHGGYPELSNAITLESGVRRFDLEIRTLKKQLLRAQIYMQGEQVMVAVSLIMQSLPEVRLQAANFLKSVKINPLPGEIRKDVPPEKKGIFSKPGKDDAPWEVLETDRFSLAFPKYPIGQHKRIRQEGGFDRYFQWHMADAETGLTFVLSITPTANFENDWKKEVNNGLKASLDMVNGWVLQEKELDFFYYPGKEVLFRSKHQYFRVRFFSDGKYLYQMVVSGNEQQVFQKAANQFLDGLKWRLINN